MTKNKSAKTIAAHFADAGRVDGYRQIFDHPLKSSDGWSDAFAYHRQDLIRRRLMERMDKGARILEIGCGTGDLITSLFRQGYDCKAVDQSSAMIEAAREKFPEEIKSGLIFESRDLFELPEQGDFDAVIVNGVIPYYREKTVFLGKVSGCLKPGGTTAITHRNALFNLFAFNSGTLNFVFDDILGSSDPCIRETAAERLAAELPSMETPKETSVSDELWRSAENPLDIDQLYTAGGLEVKQVYFTFLHPAAPRFADSKTGASHVMNFSTALEDNWRGAFAGSQFLVMARRQ